MAIKTGGNFVLSAAIFGKGANMIGQKETENARIALEQIQAYSQKRIDELVFESENILRENAAALASAEIEETSMGSTEVKISENSDVSAAFLKYKRNNHVGAMNQAVRPEGVIIAAIPVDSPVIVTAGLFFQALRDRNALIVCPDPQVKNITGDTVDLIRDALAKKGAPVDLLQIV